MVVFPRTVAETAHDFMLVVSSVPDDMFDPFLEERHIIFGDVFLGNAVDVKQRSSQLGHHIGVGGLGNGR